MKCSYITFQSYTEFNYLKLIELFHLWYLKVLNNSLYTVQQKRSIHFNQTATSTNTWQLPTWAFWLLNNVYIFSDEQFHATLSILISATCSVREETTTKSIISHYSTNMIYLCMNYGANKEYVLHVTNEQKCHQLLHTSFYSGW